MNQKDLRREAVDEQRIALRVYPQFDQENATCSYLLIRLAPADAEALLKFKDVLEAARASEKSVYLMQFWEPKLVAQPIPFGDTSEDLDQLIGADEYAMLPPGFEVRRQEGEQELELDYITAVAGEYGLELEFSLTTGGISYNTTDLPWEELEQIAKGEKS